MHGSCVVNAITSYKAQLSGLPSYLQCEIQDYHPSRTLRSTSALLLQQQPATISFAARAFCAAAPTVWNSLGVHTRSVDTFLTFKNLLLYCLDLATHNCFWRHVGRVVSVTTAPMHHGQMTGDRRSSSNHRHWSRLRPRCSPR